MPNYAKLQQTAKRLVEGAGRDVSVRRRNEVPNDTAKPWRGADQAAVPPDTDTVSVSCKAVFKAVVYVDDEDGTRRAMCEVLIAAKSVLTADDPPTEVDLRMFDELLDGSDVWSITEADPVQPGSINLLWKLKLKK